MQFYLVFVCTLICSGGRSELVSVVSTASVQVKELTFKVGIAPHDLATKQRQLESWLEKKHHVRLTLQAKRGEQANLVRKLKTSTFTSMCECCCETFFSRSPFFF